MPTTYIPESDTLVRHVKPSLVDRDPETDEVRGIFPDAFRLREVDDGALSCGWLEHYAGSRPDRITAAIAGFKNAIDVKKSSVFALGIAGAISSACERFGVRVRIVHAPETDHEAHAEVRRFNDSDDQLLALLAEEVWAELEPNRR